MRGRRPRKIPEPFFAFVGCEADRRGLFVVVLDRHGSVVQYICLLLIRSTTGPTKLMTSPELPDRVRVIDSHTGGEPTRVVLSGAPDLGPGSMRERSERFRGDWDAFRSAVVNEPRGSEAVVGALLTEPSDPSCTAGAIFFNNVGLLGMCGHATIGLAVSLAHAGRIRPGHHTLETPVGNIRFELHEDRERVTFENIRSYRHVSGVSVDVPGHGAVTGDVAWGGNWFFLSKDHGQSLDPQNAEELCSFAWSVRKALTDRGVTGADGAEVDHIELFSGSDSADVDGRCFVLCPGGAWDRSPCGTGTSAKLACLAADGDLEPGDTWRQESLIGSVFEATYRVGDGGEVVPIVTGSAWVTAESTLLFDSRDPLRAGLCL